MNKAILILLFIVPAVASFSQSVSHDDYLAKSRHQKTAAWILLGGGVGLTALGIGISQANTVDYALGNSSNHNTAGSVLAVAGVASLLGSIPLFISASHNKHKAAAVTFNMQKIPLLSIVQYQVAAFQPVVTLKIPL